MRRGRARAGARDRRGRGAVRATGPRCSARCPPLGSRGFPEPVAAFEVEWPIGRRAGLGQPALLPAPLRTVPAIPFVARPRSGNSSRRALDAVQHGGRHAVLVRGEPGAGKTRLVAEFARHAAADGATGALRRVPRRRRAAVRSRDRRARAPARPRRRPGHRRRRRRAGAHAVAGRSGRRRTTRPSCRSARIRAPRTSRPSPTSSSMPAGARRCCSCSTTSSGRAGRRCSWYCTGSASPLPLRAVSGRHASRDAGRHQRHVRRRARRVPPSRRHHARAGRRLRPSRASPRSSRPRRATTVDAVPDAGGRGARRNRPTATRSCSASCGATSSRPARSCRTARTGVRCPTLDAFDSPESVRSVVGRRIDRLPADARELLEIAAVAGSTFTVDLLATVTGTERARRARAARARDRERDRSRSSAPARSGSRTRSCGARSTTD